VIVPGASRIEAGQTHLVGDPEIARRIDEQSLNSDQINRCGCNVSAGVDAAAPVKALQAKQPANP